jgi:hypothetical protein
MITSEVIWLFGFDQLDEAVEDNEEFEVQHCYQ